MILDEKEGNKIGRKISLRFHLRKQHSTAHWHDSLCQNVIDNQGNLISLNPAIITVSSHIVYDAQKYYSTKSA